jgi:hypothetical protein
MDMTGAELINAIGIPSIVAALIFIGAKLNTLNTLKNDLDKNIKPDLKDVRERFATLEGKAANLFQTLSPISLTDKGREYLEASGLKAYINANKTLLMDKCDHTNTMSTPYDVQQTTFALFDELDFPKDIEKQLKNYAYNQGATMDALRRVGALYFRDLCLEEHGFKSEDIDSAERTH